MISIGLLNIPVIFLFDNFFNVSNWWGLIYYLLIGLFGLGFYLSMTIIKDLIRSSKLKKENVNELINKRNQAMSLLKKIIPSEYL
jgi:F0F1-type ATP synthase assembly protein I